MIFFSQTLEGIVIYAPEIEATCFKNILTENQWKNSIQNDSIVEKSNTPS